MFALFVEKLSIKQSQKEQIQKNWFFCNTLRIAKKCMTKFRGSLRRDYTAVIGLIVLTILTFLTSWKISQGFGFEWSWPGSGSIRQEKTGSRSHPRKINRIQIRIRPNFDLIKLTFFFRYKSQYLSYIIWLHLGRMAYSGGVDPDPTFGTQNRIRETRKNRFRIRPFKNIRIRSYPDLQP